MCVIETVVPPFSGRPGPAPGRHPVRAVHLPYPRVVPERRRRRSRQLIVVLLRTASQPHHPHNPVSHGPQPIRGRASDAVPQMPGGKNWILPKEINANRFVWVSHWLEISGKTTNVPLYGIEWRERGYGLKRSPSTLAKPNQAHVADVTLWNFLLYCRCFMRISRLHCCCDLKGPHSACKD